MSGRAAAAVVGVGVLGGLGSGLLGIGGGIVFVPGLVMLTGLAQRRAHATSLAAILPVGAVGAAVYALNGGRIHLGMAALLAAGGIVGAPLGVRALARIPEAPLRLLFIAALVAAGIRFLVG